METVKIEDMNNVMDDPEQGCIVQADDPNMLAGAFDGANASSTLSTNNSWYWTSMLKLMEQGAAAAPSTHATTAAATTNSITYNGSHFTPGQNTGHTPMPAAASSPSSSSVHDQPFDNILVNNNAINTNDPDSSVWSQEFLSGPICESKPSNVHHLACSDDGLHELLYPRTVLELLFSDQLKLEQLPSWPDILHQTVGATSGKSFGFPLAPLDKPATAAPTLHNVNSENQLDVKIPPFLHMNYSHLAGLDDRLSSSTASSTLSDNAIDQWPAQPNAGAQCEHVQAPRSSTIMHASPLNSMQQIDYTHVKQEYTHSPSPPYTSNDITNQYPKLGSPYLHQNQRLIANTAGNVMDEAILNNEFEQKPGLINKHWTASIIPNDPLNHRHHIYESITAANFAHNVRLAGLDAANCFQHVNNQMGGTDHSRIGHHGAAAALHYVNQQPSAAQQIGKKSRPLEAAGTGQVDEARKENSITEVDTKAKGAGHIIPGGTNVSSPKQAQQPQLSGTEYNCKRSRIDQNPPPPPPPTTSSSFKNPPIRKEKLGERITTLQQLVSPFGKTDTASVLLEAIGYIKFLQEQVQALSSPYFKSPSTQSGDDVKPDLRSRGLCLVPLSCTMQVANDNGADYWYGGAFR